MTIKNASLPADLFSNQDYINHLFGQNLTPNTDIPEVSDESDVIIINPSQIINLSKPLFSDSTLNLSYDVLQIRSLENNFVNNFINSPNNIIRPFFLRAGNTINTNRQLINLLYAAMDSSLSENIDSFSFLLNPKNSTFFAFLETINQLLFQLVTHIPDDLTKDETHLSFCFFVKNQNIEDVVNIFFNLINTQANLTHYKIEKITGISEVCCIHIEVGNKQVSLLFTSVENRSSFLEGAWHIPLEFNVINKKQELNATSLYLEELPFLTCVKKQSLSYTASAKYKSILDFLNIISADKCIREVCVKFSASLSLFQSVLTVTDWIVGNAEPEWQMNENHSNQSLIYPVIKRKKIQEALNDFNTYIESKDKESAAKFGGFFSSILQLISGNSPQLPTTVKCCHIEKNLLKERLNVYSNNADPFMLLVCYLLLIETPYPHQSLKQLITDFPKLYAAAKNLNLEPFLVQQLQFVLQQDYRPIFNRIPKELNEKTWWKHLCKQTSTSILQFNYCIWNKISTEHPLRRFIAQELFKSSCLQGLPQSTQLLNEFLEDPAQSNNALFFFCSHLPKLQKSNLLVKNDWIIIFELMEKHLINLKIDSFNKEKLLKVENALSDAITTLHNNKYLKIKTDRLLISLNRKGFLISQAGNLWKKRLAILINTHPFYAVALFNCLIHEPSSKIVNDQKTIQSFFRYLSSSKAIQSSIHPFATNQRNTYITHSSDPFSLFFIEPHNPKPLTQWLKNICCTTPITEDALTIIQTCMDLWPQDDLHELNPSLITLYKNAATQHLISDDLLPVLSLAQLFMNFQKRENLCNQTELYLCYIHYLSSRQLPSENINHSDDSALFLIEHEIIRTILDTKSLTAEQFFLIYDKIEYLILHHTRTAIELKEFENAFNWLKILPHPTDKLKQHAYNIWDAFFEMPNLLENERIGSHLFLSPLTKELFIDLRVFKPQVKKLLYQIEITQLHSQEHLTYWLKLIKTYSITDPIFWKAFWAGIIHYEKQIQIVYETFIELNLALNIDLYFHMIKCLNKIHHEHLCVYFKQFTAKEELLRVFTNISLIKDQALQIIETSQFIKMIEILFNHAANQIKTQEEFDTVSEAKDLVFHFLYPLKNLKVDLRDDRLPRKSNNKSPFAFVQFSAIVRLILSYTLDEAQTEIDCKKIIEISSYFSHFFKKNEATYFFENQSDIDQKADNVKFEFLNTPIINSVRTSLLQKIESDLMMKATQRFKDKTELLFCVSFNSINSRLTPILHSNEKSVNSNKTKRITIDPALQKDLTFFLNQITKLLELKIKSQHEFESLIPAIILNILESDVNVLEKLKPEVLVTILKSKDTDEIKMIHINTYLFNIITIALIKNVISLDVCCQTLINPLSHLFKIIPQATLLFSLELLENIFTMRQDEIKENPQMFLRLFNESIDVLYKEFQGLSKIKLDASNNLMDCLIIQLESYFDSFLILTDPNQVTKKHTECALALIFISYIRDKFLLAAQKNAGGDDNNTLPFFKRLMKYIHLIPLSESNHLPLFTYNKIHLTKPAIPIRLNEFFYSFSIVYKIKSLYPNLELNMAALLRLATEKCFLCDENELLFKNWMLFLLDHRKYTTHHFNTPKPQTKEESLSEIDSNRDFYSCIQHFFNRIIFPFTLKKNSIIPFYAFNDSIMTLFINPSVGPEDKNIADYYSTLICALKDLIPDHSNASAERLKLGLFYLRELCKQIRYRKTAKHRFFQKDEHLQFFSRAIVLCCQFQDADSPENKSISLLDYLFDIMNELNLSQKFFDDFHKHIRIKLSLIWKENQPASLFFIKDLCDTLTHLTRKTLSNYVQENNEIKKSIYLKTYKIQFETTVNELTTAIINQKITAPSNPINFQENINLLFFRESLDIDQKLVFQKMIHKLHAHQDSAELQNFICDLIYLERASIQSFFNNQSKEDKKFIEMQKAILNGKKTTKYNLLRLILKAEFMHNDQEIAINYKNIYQSIRDFYAVCETYAINESEQKDISQCKTPIIDQCKLLLLSFKKELVNSHSNEIKKIGSKCILFLLEFVKNNFQISQDQIPLKLTKIA